MAVEERLPEPSNPLGLDGIEFVEYATSEPQAFGAVLLIYFLIIQPSTAKPAPEKK